MPFDRHYREVQQKPITAKPRLREGAHTVVPATLHHSGRVASFCTQLHLSGLNCIFPAICIIPAMGVGGVTGMTETRYIL
jgi:hypothetical protein